MAGRLRLPDEEATDVLEELRSHLAESAAGLVGEGLTAEQAERESIARLGNPDALADGIRTARQTRRRMLAAAGAGVIAATSGLFWGYLFAFALTTVAGRQPGVLRFSHCNPNEMMIVANTPAIVARATANT